MQQFSNSEIDEAKKRVRDMQQRTRAPESGAEKTEEFDLPLFESLVQVLSPLKSGDKMTPLALLTLLAALKENDNKTLLMALIFILF